MSSHNEPRRLLAPRDAIAIMVGLVIGAGIFKTPSMVAGMAGDAGWILLIWLLGAVISLAGALCYAELSAAYPHAGGDYHFLARAYGKNISFLYAWAKATVIHTGSVALLAFVFGDFMTQVLVLGPYSSAIWAVAVVLVLTLINLLGVHQSARLQSTLTVLEVLGLLAIVVAGFVVERPVNTDPAIFSSQSPLGLLGLALVFVLLTFGGWNEAAYISAEVKGDAQAIVKVLVTSLAIITLVYGLVNIALLNGLGVAGLAQSKTAGADLLGLAFGPWAQKVLGLFVAIAALTSINATLIVGARNNYAMGRDWPLLGFMGRWNAQKGTPALAYLIQAAMSLALIGFGLLQADGFSAMVEFTAPVFWLFLLLVGLSLFWLRRKDGLTHRPFNVPLYPFTPLVFCAACAYLAYSSIVYAASQNAVHVSLWVMATGVAVLLLMNFRQKPAIISVMD
ncbi:MAG: amino acid permease [Burkholderiaceae bacterium]